MKRIVVIANCQCLPISDAFSLCARGVESDFIDVNFIDHPNTSTKIDRLLSNPSDYIVLSFNISEKIPRVSTAELKPIFGDRLVTFSNLYFAGLHPDITYIGSMGNRMVGFFGDYHSMIISTAYAEGYSAEDAQKLFVGATYQKLGYFERFQASTDEMRARDRNCDVQFGESFWTLSSINFPYIP